ncbi:MAG: helix-turn-helix transcriptional regulator [Pseudomonadota bacterium]
MQNQELTSQAQHLGHLLARLRLARQVKQGEAAANAGLSRSTAARIEKGDASVAIGHLLAYLRAIAPGTSLQDLLNGADPALAALDDTEKRHRVRSGSPAGQPQL